MWNVLEMKKRDVIVTSCTNSTIVFWNLQTFKKEGTVQNVYAGTPKHMIELPNQFIAVSNYIPPNPIVIIDSFNYMKIQEIHQQGHIV